MKSKLIKHLTLSVIGILIIAITAGCRADDAQEANVIQPPQNEPQATPAAPQGGEDAAEVSNALIAEPLTFEFLVPENALSPISQDSVVLQAIQEKTNVTINFMTVPGADWDTRRSVLLATNMMPDVIRGNPQDIRRYGRMGMFLNLSDYEDYMPTFMNIINAPDRYADTRVMFMDGNLFGFFRLEYDRVSVAPQPIIRMDLLERHNIPIPSTWDELYQAFLDLKEQYPDTYMLSSRMGTNYMIGQMAFSLGSGGFEGFATGQGIYWEPNQGMYLYGPIQPEFRYVVEWFRNMFQDGLLDPDYAVATRDIVWERLSSGRLLFNHGNNSFAATTFNPALEQIDPGARFEMLAPMYNSFGQRRSLRFQRDWFDTVYMINADVDRASDIVRFFDWLYTPEGIMISNFGVEDTSYYLDASGVPQIMPDLLERHQGAPDVLNSIQAEIGGGHFHFTPFISEVWQRQAVAPLMAEHGLRIDALANEGIMHFMRNDLFFAFSEDETDQLVTWQNNVMTVFNSEIDRFIMGTRSMDEWDDFVAQLVAHGAQDIQDLYNYAYTRMRG